MLAGNLVSLLSSGLISVVVSWLKPDDYDWASTKALVQIHDSRDIQVYDPEFEEDPARLSRAAKVAYTASIVLTLGLIIVSGMLIRNSLFNFAI